MNIGVLGSEFIGWGGGVDFIRFIVSSILAADDKRDHTIFIILPISGPKVKFQAINERIRFYVKWVVRAGCAQRNVAPNRKIILDIFRQFGERVKILEIDKGCFALTSAVQRNRINVLIPVMDPSLIDCEVPYVGYLFDFQHKYYPEYFSKKEIDGRDAAFLRRVTEPHCVIVNALTVADDVDKFIPSRTSRIFVMPFSPAPDVSWFDNDPKVVAKRYGIGRPYFIVCNQFWIHKNHETAFRAFSALLKESPDIQLVCTGETTDRRFPGLYKKLMQIVFESGCSSHITVLGLIPKKDQIALLRGSIALVQPTLFEGGPGGGATYDAISVGVPVVLSDIPVNKEVIGNNLFFFEAQNSHALKNAMKTVLATRDLGRETRENLVRVGDEHRVNCGRVLIDAIEYSIKHSSE